MRRCRDCYYFDSCKVRRVCRYFDSVKNLDELDDDIIASYLHKDKQQFIHDWNLYVERDEVE